MTSRFGGPLSSKISSDVATFISKGVSLDLDLNPSKREVISHSGTISHPQFAGLCQVSPSPATLLGSPLSSGLAMDDAISTLNDDLQWAANRLSLVSSHDVLILLKNCLSGRKLLHVMRTTSCFDNPQLSEFDDLLRIAVKKMCSFTLSDDQWTQASLPVHSVSLGVCSVSKLSSSAFLSSTASTLSLQTLILRRTQVNEIDSSKSLVNWKGLSSETH